MPKRMPGEKRETYMRRCVPMVINEGTAKNQKQAVAICMSMFEAKRKPVKGDFNFTGKMKLLAKAGSSKKQTIMLVANTGKPMDLSGFEHPVIVDMKGAVFDRDVTPILADHNTDRRIGHTTQQVIVRAGEKRKFGEQMVVGPKIVATGIRSSNMQIAKGIMADAKTGFPFQVSIGARIKKGYVLDEGDTAEVNGRMWEGPLIVASRSVIRELSVTVLGADNDTSAIVARSQEKFVMKFSEFVKSLGFDPNKLEAKQKKNLMALFKTKAPSKKIKATEPDEEEEDDEEEAPARRKVKKTKVLATAGGGDDDNDPITRQNLLAADNSDRIESINEVAAEFAPRIKFFQIEGKKGPEEIAFKAMKAKAIKENWSAEKFELLCRRQDLPDLSDDGPSIQMVKKDVNAKAIEVNILRAFGVTNSSINAKTQVKYGIEHMGYDEEVLEASHKKQNNVGLSFNELLRLQVLASGKYPGAYSGSDLMAEAKRAWDNRDLKAGDGFSGISVTNILENVMHKAAWASFESVESIWRFICGRRPVNDFKAHSLYRLDMQGHFRKVAADGELKHVSMVDTKKTISAETYGAMIAIDRKTQIDDDLGLVLAKARSIGLLAGLRIEESVFVLLLANTGSLFASGNGNLLTGASSALSVDSITTAKQSFRDKVINYKPISVSPRILLVGTGLEVTADRICNQSEFRVTGGSTSAVQREFVNNPHRGTLTPYVSGYLNNTSIKDQDGIGLVGQNTTQWFLFADPNAPQGSALTIAFLNGRESPYFDEAETSFSIPGGIQMRAYMDWGVALHIPQMGLRSAGR